VGAGALAKLDPGFSMLAYGVPRSTEAGEAVTRHLDHLHDEMRPWAAGGGFLNMTERPAPLEEILPADTCVRLAEVKRRWDPDGMIGANHEISLTPA
jgi:hypothetical protein